LTVLIYFRRFYKPKINLKTNKTKNAIFALSKKQTKAIRSAYYGGRTELFKPYIENLTVYDINSATPVGLEVLLQ
jgi:hypothetical protein